MTQMAGTGMKRALTADELEWKFVELRIGTEAFRRAYEKTFAVVSKGTRSASEAELRTDALLSHLLEDHMERHGEDLGKSLDRHLSIVGVLEQELFHGYLRR